jgi:hypothetical protein
LFCWKALRLRNRHAANTKPLDPSTFNISDFILNSVLSINKNVERVILTKENHDPIGFAHLCFDGTNCVVVGGVIPKLINSGAGIYTALVVYDYLFKNWPTFQSITINILKTNKVSIKMNLKLGFEAVEESKLYDCIQFKFILNKNTFPNTYCKKILSKFQYEIR